MQVIPEPCCSLTAPITHAHLISTVLTILPFLPPLTHIPHSIKGTPKHTVRFCSPLFPATRFIPIPTPSITASKHAHPTAPLPAAFTPPRTASAPPVRKPAITTGTHTYNQHPVPIPRHTTSHQNTQTEKLTSVIRILLLSHPLHGTIKRREQATPHAEIPAEDGRARFYRGEGVDPALALLKRFC